MYADGGLDVCRWEIVCRHGCGGDDRDIVARTRIRGSKKEYEISQSTS